MDEIHVVNLGNHRWDLSGIPCNHAVSCINWMKEDPERYVNDYFKVKQSSPVEAEEEEGGEEEVEVEREVCGVGLDSLLVCGRRCRRSPRLAGIEAVLVFFPSSSSFRWWVDADVVDIGAGRAVCAVVASSLPTIAGVSRWVALALRDGEDGLRSQRGRRLRLSFGDHPSTVSLLVFSTFRWWWTVARVDGGGGCALHSLWERGKRRWRLCRGRGVREELGIRVWLTGRFGFKCLKPIH
ncbi:hypothetical protein Cni_G29264 [Canna indica]|uniref:Zinc finger PMZ-type domain-containing protein n=1 Tax=Canna indica TaxID=4628 RepID=A0AAQ3QR36_9LILI|nr:hypothetical protein Cni_G29264 [Canna indica]